MINIQSKVTLATFPEIIENLSRQFSILEENKQKGYITFISNNKKDTLFIQKVKSSKYKKILYLELERGSDVEEETALESFFKKKKVFQFNLGFWNKNNDFIFISSTEVFENKELIFYLLINYIEAVEFLDEQGKTCFYLKPETVFYMLFLAIEDSKNESEFYNSPYYKEACELRKKFFH